MASHRHRPALGLLLAVGAIGCGPADEDPWVDGELGVIRSGLTVGQAGGCSTAIVAGLSKQLIEEQNCIRPNALVSFAGKPHIAVGAGVFPFLEPPAAAALERAAAAQGGTLQVSSAFRTLAQQYLLYKWMGGCGIQIAAAPGKSNHETGLALDVSNYNQYKSALENRGWRWYGPGDVVHFDYVGGGTVDLRSESVRAFQRLWNLNHPNDRIAEDGAYGPQTAARLGATDVNGFAKSPTCAQPPPPPKPAWNGALGASGGPALLVAGTVGKFWVEFRNTGNTTWRPGSTRLGTTQPRDRLSALAAPSWLGPGRAAAVQKVTAPGEVGRFEFELRAPQVNGPTAYSEHFGLVEEGVTWFGPEDQYAAEVEVVPPLGHRRDHWGGPRGGIEGDESALGPTALHPVPAPTGGCALAPAASGRGALLVGLLLALALRRRRPGSSRGRS